ncbi:hypothetical protein GF327_06510 [Candidatus Woesearchaeota archaeon]|nr:hypothetical protein [Candidatus Woesearchaeota archaeon]
MENDFVFEELELDCGVCGKKITMIVHKDYDPSDFVCQRCSFGEIEAGDESSD